MRKQFQHPVLRSRIALFAGIASLLSVPFAAAQNNKVSRVLAMFDINRNGVPDAAEFQEGVLVDFDGDGLPDTWEIGGRDPQGTDVPFPAPEPIVPGTPPLPIFSRFAVRTSAESLDTDGDGLSDFVEVFGLKFIDDNRNGILDDACARDAGGAVLFNVDGTPVRLTCEGLAAGSMFRSDSTGAIVATSDDCGTGEIGEWFDFNGDGMPSIGEYPARNRLPLKNGGFSDADYDGFVYTNPSKADTDGDGIIDSLDNDPLVNPRTFGSDSNFFSSGGGSLSSDQDKDNDGLGNGMDMGNDILEQIDNPSDLSSVIELFRPSLAASGAGVPEGLIEELLGADWNGDGLFRSSDIQDPHFGLTGAPEPRNLGGQQEGGLFSITDPSGGAAPIDLGFFATRFPVNFNTTEYNGFESRGNGINAPLPFQEVLAPLVGQINPFLPDPRIWTVLYSYRMPGFDVDGNGFIGFDTASFGGCIEYNGLDVLVPFCSNDGTALNCTTGNAIEPTIACNALPTTQLKVSGQRATSNELDGQISPCGLGTLFGGIFGLLGLVTLSVRRSWIQC